MRNECPDLVSRICQIRMKKLWGRIRHRGFLMKRVWERFVVTFDDLYGVKIIVRALVYRF